MNRHDIRLRRERMTTGRMQRHKDYKELMEKHKRTSRVKRASAWLGAVIIVLLLGLLLLAVFKRLEKIFGSKEPVPTEASAPESSSNNAPVLRLRG